MISPCIPQGKLLVIYLWYEFLSIQRYSTFHDRKRWKWWPWVACSTEGKNSYFVTEQMNAFTEAPLLGASNQQTGKEGAAWPGESAPCIDHLSARNHPSGVPPPSDAHFQHFLFQLCQGKGESHKIQMPFFFRIHMLWSTRSCWPTCASIASNRNAFSESWSSIALTCTLMAFCEEKTDTFC